MKFTLTTYTSFPPEVKTIQPQIINSQIQPVEQV